MKLIHVHLFEEFETSESDAPESASDKTSANDIDATVKEYIAKKNIVSNIYNTYTDEKDLEAKLLASKLISKDGNTIKFTNPLLNAWADVAAKTRKMENIKKQVDDFDKQSKDLTASINRNPSSKDDILADIKLLNDRIKIKNDEVIQINKELLLNQKDVDKQLADMKQRLLDISNKIEK